jgi:tRNA dimethylallyltransferase
MNRSPIVLAGATAVGKSDVALYLADYCSGEIVSVDSMQVYRGLDIGTAKPSVEERTRVPHHLIDVVDLGDRFDAAQFVSMAQAAVASIQSRQRIPILCGGTGLYFQAWLKGLGVAPAPDPILRATLEAAPLGELLDELARHDPVTFDAIDLANARRVVRAVEVIRLTGRPFSEQRARWSEQGPEIVGRKFGFKRSRDDLTQRIEQRVDRMFTLGLVEETRSLMSKGLAENPTAMQAIGYRQVVEHLRGDHGLRETIERVKAKTRQFAKRQSTWFEGQMDLEWIELEPNTPASALAEKLWKRIQT